MAACNAITVMNQSVYSTVFASNDLQNMLLKSGHDMVGHSVYTPI